MNTNMMLVGLGPLSKKIYIKIIKKYKLNLSVLVEVESNYESVKNYLEANGFSNTEIWLLPDEYKYEEELPSEYEHKLKEICNEYNITHIINSTEPKSHHMYLKFALKNNINILSDKPITAVKGMEKIENIEKVRKQYYELLELYKNCTCNCKIMCQREYNKGYMYVFELLSNIIKKYNIPITYIDIYTCDGRWEMPHDMDKENHPFKYGYGKLYHSGYHFIDLLAELLKLNNLTTEDKRIVSGTLYGNIFTPNDEKVVCNSNDFKKIFKNQKLNDIYNNLENIDFKNYGERNFYGQLNFMNKNNNLITTANLNLLKYGTSRRNWINSEEHNSSFGKMRHERLNIQVGPLINIQVHSYQSKENIDKIDDGFTEFEPGGVDHFDIDIYRNSDIIGGKPFERIKLKDLYNSEEVSRGSFNLIAREDGIKDFLENKSKKSNLENHKLAMEILYSASKIIYDKNNNKVQIEEIKIPK